MKITNSIKFFLNPAPFIFTSVVLAALNLIDVRIEWQYILLPVMIWAIYFSVIVGVLIWSGVKILGKVIEILKTIR